MRTYLIRFIPHEATLKSGAELTFSPPDETVQADYFQWDSGRDAGFVRFFTTGEDGRTVRVYRADYIFSITEQDETKTPGPEYQDKVPSDSDERPPVSGLSVIGMAVRELLDNAFDL